MPLPSAYQFRVGVRQLISYGSAALPKDTGIRFERWFRGYEEKKKLDVSDAVVISFGKSGRTWVRVLLSRFFAHRFGLPEGSLMEFDEFHRVNPKIPVLFFTHDNYLKDYLGTEGKFDLYGRTRVILLVRDPRDTAVSQYFQWKHRMLPRKKVINGYPADSVDLYGFVSGEAAGIPKIIDFMNGWAKDLERFPNLLVVRYEDLKADTAGQLARMLRFVGQQPQEAELADAVQFASIDNMRKMETENAGKFAANARLKPGDAANPSSFKVRRAKVGGWRDYLTEEQADIVDAMVRERLSPVFGYE